MVDSFRETNNYPDFDMTRMYNMASIHVDDIKESMRDVLKKSSSKSNGDFDALMATFFKEEPGVVKRNNGGLNSRSDSALSNLIENKIQTQTLPLALRKRLLYQRSVQDSNA